MQLKALKPRYTPLDVSAERGYDNTLQQPNRANNGKDTRRGHHSRIVVSKKDDQDTLDNRRDGPTDRRNGPNERKNRSNRRDRHGNFY